LKKAVKYTIAFLALSFLSVFAGLLVFQYMEIEISLKDISLLSFSFCIANVITIVLFFRGQLKDKHAQAFFTLVGISLKFLIELVIALFWFLILKKTEISFIVLFFVLYLTFTIFSIFVILNTLKNNSL
jgi:hypothetical protein